jgi:hypothetical protein
MQCQHVLYLDTQHAQLPLAMREAYLADVQAWVAGMCRWAARNDRSTLGLIDALYGLSSSSERIARWRSIGPHASLRREFQLSDDAVSILLLACAPYLWGAMTHVYAAIARPIAGVLVNQHLLAALVEDRFIVLRELCREAPLVRNHLVRVRPTGAIVPSTDVLRRFAGG